MSPLIAIARFELARRMRLLTTYVFFALFAFVSAFFVLAAGNAIPGASVDFGTGTKVSINAPSSLVFMFIFGGLFCLLISAAVSGGATHQDIEHQTTPFFFTAPVSKLAYLGGRYLGSLASLAFMSSGIALGAFAGANLPLIDPTRRGPDHLAAYADAYLLGVVPNLLLTTAIFFCLAALWKRMLPVYVGGVVLLIGYVIATNLAGDTQNRTLAALIDPFGLQAVDKLIEYWSVSERDTRLVPLAGVFLENRLIWLGVTAAILGLTFVRFRFALPRVAAGRIEEVAAAPIERAKIPDVTLDYSPRARLSLLWSLTRLQARETVRSVFFLVVLLAGALFVLSAAGDVGKLYGTRTVPVTYEVLEIVGGSFSIFILLVIAFYSGELVWRERDARLSQIADATPAPRHVVFASKLATLMIIQIILLAMVMVMGILVQTFHGYTHYEISLYFKALFGTRLPGIWMLCVLGIAIHAVFDNRLAGYGGMIGFFVSTLVLGALGLDDRLYRYGGNVPYVYSAMNGFGHFAKPLAWFTAYWSFGAIALGLVASAFWQRGVDASFRQRLRAAKKRLAGPVLRAALALSLLVFAAIGAFIFYNTHVLNTYLDRSDREERRAEYEHLYKAAYSTKPMPRVVSAKLDVDLFPERRAADLRGTLELENTTEWPIDTVAVTIPAAAHIKKLVFEGGSVPAFQDRLRGFSICKLASPIAAGARTRLTFDLAYENPGFRGDEPDNRFAENGTFLESTYVPQIGYVSSLELESDAVRHRHGLEPRKWPDAHDPAARMRNYVDPSSDWIRFDATVSTSPDQLAIAPGSLVRSWNENGRAYFEYQPIGPILNIYAFQSGRYAALHDRWNQVDIEIDYHPEHTFDLDRMVKSIKASLAYFTDAFGPYQHKIVRIVEFPRYEQFAESLPNTIPYSESIGFIADVDDKKPDEIDFPYYVTAHEVAHQWWAHQVIGAEVQGATVLSETLSQYSALMVMKRAYGPLALKKFLRYELDRYLRGRGREDRPEKPLVLVEDQPYIHYAKGSLAMVALADAIGEDKVNAALKTFVQEHGFKGPPYPIAEDLVDAFRAVAPESNRLLEDLFETITLFDARAVNATATKRQDGSLDVHLTGTVKKVRADELGHETEVPLDDDLPIGALDDKDQPVAVERVHVKGGALDATIHVPKAAAKAGIDPASELIDRKPEDNFVKIEGL